jgi:magnesium-transporting ATPase (P-type)
VPDTAAVRLTEGSVLLDQSMLTGESVPIEAAAGFETYAGALVRRGEERRRLGSSCPSRSLVASSAVDLLIASTLATFGIAMAPLPLLVVGGTLVAAVVFAFVLDLAKVPVFNRLRIG